MNYLHMSGVESAIRVVRLDTWRIDYTSLPLLYYILHLTFPNPAIRIQLTVALQRRLDNRVLDFHTLELFQSLTGYGLYLERSYSASSGDTFPKMTRLLSML